MNKEIKEKLLKLYFDENDNNIVVLKNNKYLIVSYDVKAGHLSVLEDRKLDAWLGMILNLIFLLIFPILI